jgi:hypothetical protein
MLISKLDHQAPKPGEARCVLGNVLCKHGQIENLYARRKLLENGGYPARDFLPPPVTCNEVQGEREIGRAGNAVVDKPFQVSSIEKSLGNAVELQVQVRPQPRSG